MDKFVKGENIKVENTSEGTHSNKNRRREESAGLSVCPPPLT